MYHVLVVDDEIHTVRGLKAGVAWNSCNVASVHTAHSAKQARAVFEAHPVHLLICDIEMPQESGLELLAWVRVHYPATETIFLTCHSDFSYARQAIHLDSFDYLLKPVEYSALETVIRKALDKIRKSDQLLLAEKQYEHYQQLWESHRPEVREKFWQELVYLDAPSASVNAHHLGYTEAMLFVPVLIHVQRWSRAPGPNEEQIREHTLRQYAKRRFASYAADVVVLPYKSGYSLAVFAIEADQAPDGLREWCDGFIKAVADELECELCCFIGASVTLRSFADMVRSLHEAIENNVLRVNRTFTRKHAESWGLQVQPPAMSEWTEWMKIGAKERLLSHIMRYLETLDQQSQGIDVKSIRLFCHNILQMTFFVLQMKGQRPHEVLAGQLYADNPVTQLRSLQAVRDWVRLVIEGTLNHLAALQEELTIVQKAKQFIAVHIGQHDLSRLDIASSVFVNPDYLTRLFKKETGGSISHYLQQQRIELAKELLAGTELAISDIALTVGYSNLSYFSAIFKKATKMNPINFRKRSQGQSSTG